ncbi:uncharacterized protein LOC105207572 isoform X2 [Solenopsis invicta]|nr:uncharacterized protein LOC105207572 isoform X2 [Solenopsis invicta]
MPCLSAMFPLVFLLAGANAAGIGEAWQVTPYVKATYTDRPFRPRLDSSAFEVRTVSGVGRLVPFDDSRNVQKLPELTTPGFIEPNALPVEAEEALRENENLEQFRKLLQNLPYGDEEAEDDVVKDGSVPIQRIFQKTLMMKILHDENPADKENDGDDEQANTRGIVQRIRRQVENETSMEKISSTKNVREARLNSPEILRSTAAQPISVEFRHRIPLDQVIQQQQEEEEAAALSSIYRRHQAPRADFVTGQHRRYPDYRESRDLPVSKNYDDYDRSWYRNMIRERDYEYPSYRRGYSYQYPDRYRMERDYYMRPSSDQYYYDRYDRYRDDDLDLYNRNRPAPRPRRIIYYATLPEIVRKPVDLRNYPRYDTSAARTSVLTRDDTYKRVPGNVDPGKYRYRLSYSGYDPYTKRSSYYDRPYGYPEEDSRRVRVSTKEDMKNDRFGGANSERKISNLIAIRDDESDKLPWPVQIGTEVNIKEDERIPGRKIYGESSIGYERFHYERFQSAQLQKASDATGSSELRSDN